MSDRSSSRRTGARARADGRATGEPRARRTREPKGQGGGILRIVVLLVIVALVGVGFYFMREMRMDGAVANLAAVGSPKKPDATLDDLPDGERLAIRQAAGLGDAVLPRVIRAVEEGTPGQRTGPLYCLALLGGPDAVDTFAQVAEADPAAEEATTAAACLGRLGSSSSRSVIGRWARSNELPLARLAMTAALEAPERTRDDAIGELSPLEESTEPSLQTVLLDAYGKLPMKDDRSSNKRAGYMVQMLLGGSPEVSKAALEELQVKKAELRQLDSYDRYVSQLRLGGMSADSLDVKVNTRILLRTLGTPEAVTQSRSDLQDDAPEIVREAAITLRENRDSDSCGALLGALERGLPAAQRQIALAIDACCIVNDGKGSANLERLTSLSTRDDVIGAGACMVLGLASQEGLLKQIYARFAEEDDEVERALLHEGLVELAGVNKGDHPRDWTAWWSRNEKIFELKRLITEAIDQAKAIGAEGDRERYPEAKKILEVAQQQLFQLEELEDRKYNRWHQEVGSMLDGLHKHTIIDLDD